MNLELRPADRGEVAGPALPRELLLMVMTLVGLGNYCLLVYIIIIISIIIGIIIIIISSSSNELSLVGIGNSQRAPIGASTPASSRAGSEDETEGT